MKYVTAKASLTDFKNSITLTHHERVPQCRDPSVQPCDTFKVQSFFASYFVHVHLFFLRKYRSEVYLAVINVGLSNSVIFLQLAPCLAQLTAVGK